MMAGRVVLLSESWCLSGCLFLRVDHRAACANSMNFVLTEKDAERVVLCVGGCGRAANNQRTCGDMEAVVCYVARI